MGQPRPIGSSLFARPKPPPKKVRGFLKLPAELRNSVYDYYFQDEFRAEIVAHGTPLVKPKPKTVKLYVSPLYDRVKTRTPLPDAPPKTIRMSRVLGKYKHIDGFQTKWTSSLSALTLVSKQIYTETISYLYLNTTFVFDAPRRMSNFIQSVPAGNLAYVTKLILHYSTYGDPRYNSTFQEKHIKSWMVACKTASKSLVNLQKLEIFLRQNGTFSYFSLRDPSLQPLLQFRQLSSRRATSRPDRLTSVAEISNGLSTVVVHFSTRYTRGWDEQRYREHVCSKLHHLHGMAISRAILNLDEKDGLDDAKESIMQDARWMFRLASG